MAEINEDSAFRAYMLTGNNPQNLLDGLEIDFETATEEDFQNGLQFLINTWIDGDKNHKPRNPDINGVACVFERGENGTPHAHILICCKNPIKVRSLKTRFPRFHIDILKMASDAKDYIYKREAFTNKASTQLCEPREWGKYFVTNSESGGERMHDVADRYVRQGLTPNQIIRIEPRFARTENMLYAIYNAYIQEQVPTYREIYTEWHLGRSGTGKTHVFLDLCDKYGSDNVYLVSGTSKHPWDRYEERIKKVVIDELRASTFQASELLGILDGYRIALDARYHDKLANWDELHITSIIPPETIWEKNKGSDGERDTFDQLLRRLNVITYHYIDNNIQGIEKFKCFSIPANDYKGIQELEDTVLACLSKQTTLL